MHLSYTVPHDIAGPHVLCRFLWYVLKDRKFDQAAVDDLVHLKQVMALSNEDVAEALRERCIRIEKKFGNLMLSPEGVCPSCVCCYSTVCGDCATCGGVPVSSAASRVSGMWEREGRV